MRITQFNQPPVVHHIADPQHGLTAATLTHPAGWQAQSQVVWNFQHHSLPNRVFGRVVDPQSGTMVELFPIEAFCWIEPNMGFRQPGQDAGGGLVLLQPMPAMDTMTQWVIPRYRNTQAMRLVGGSAVPPQQLMLGMQNTAPQPNKMMEGVCVKVELMENGRAFEEEFYGLRVAYPGNPSYGAAGTLVQYNWGFERLFSFRAPQGQLDLMREVCWNIVRSLRVNPAWEQLNAQVLQQLQQQFNHHISEGYARINDATRMSQQISAQNQQFLDQQQQQRDAAWQSHQQRHHQASDAGGFAYNTNDAFGDAMMGRETYNDPYHQYGSQHTGYHEYVWTDSQGNYQYSNDANFDPNLNSSGTWVPMQKKQVNQ